MSQPPWPLVTAPLRNPGFRSSDSSRPIPESDSPHDIPIIAICHLGWDWVWQRPQQFLSRFARRHRVLFVETYRSEVETSRVDLRTPEAHPNVTVMQMHLPASRWEDGQFIDAERRRVMLQTLSR